jgi:NitT/TauT family transport system substrate-binding protein
MLGIAPECPRVFKKASIIIVAVLGLGGLALAFRPGADFPPFAQRPESISIAEASQPVFALLYLAKEKGFFREENLEVQLTAFTSGRDALNYAVEGGADLATAHETPVVIKAYENVELGIITTLHTSTRNTGLVARKDRGIAAPSDLKGKRIGLTKNTHSEFCLGLLLQSAGIDYAAVTIVDIPPPQVVAALAEGRVDAIVSWNPHLHAAGEALAPDQSVTMFSDLYIERSVLAGRRGVIAQKGEAMTRLLRAIVKAERFYSQHTHEALDLVVKRWGKPAEESVRAAWSGFQAEAKLDNVLLKIMEDGAQWLRTSGKYSSTPPDVRNIFFIHHLKTVQPESVTIVDWGSG